MRIAFVTAYPPSRLRVRAYGFVRELARRHEVTVVTLCRDDREVETAYALREDGLQIVAIREPSWIATARATRAVIAGTSLQIAHGGAASLRHAVNELAATGRVDLVHVEHLRAIAAVRDVRIPLVWDAVDCISHLYELGARYGATPMMRAIGRMEARRARVEEQRLLSRLSHVVVSSSRERDALAGAEIDAETGEGGAYDATPASHHQAAIHVVPNGVDLDYFVPQAIPRITRTVIFSGRMSFHANVAAATLLVRQIMPLVWRLCPDVRVILAGSDPPRSIRMLAADPCVSVTGYVGDLRPYLASATVAVSPAPYAVGVQNKVLEALAMGVPVVATPSSVGGLPPEAVRCLLVADSPSDVASALISLLHDTPRREQLGNAGREYIIRHHSWQEATRKLLEVYDMSLKNASKLSRAESHPSVVNVWREQRCAGV